MPVRSELEPIAIVGYSITLPKDVVTGQRFFELIRQKTQLTEAIDVVEAGRYDMSLVDENDTKNPWKLRGRHSTFFTEEESESFDAAFFNLPAKMLKTLQPIQAAILQSVWEALENAGFPATKVYRTNTGIFCAAYSNFGGYPYVCPSWVSQSYQPSNALHFPPPRSGSRGPR